MSDRGADRETRRKTSHRRKSRQPMEELARQGPARGRVLCATKPQRIPCTPSYFHARTQLVVGAASLGAQCAPRIALGRLSIQDTVYQVPRIHLPRRWVNKA